MISVNVNRFFIEYYVTAYVVATTVKGAEDSGNVPENIATKFPNYPTDIPTFQKI